MSYEYRDETLPEQTQKTEKEILDEIVARFDPDLLHNEYQLGEQLRQFKNSIVMNFLRENARVEVEQLREKLVNAPAEDVEQGRKLRFDIEVRVKMFDWIDEAIQAGESAADQLMQIQLAGETDV